jgi:hypothetical protein
MNASHATCPECGALHVAGLTCAEQFGVLLAWEYDDPELQAEHFLTVACYNVQHPAQFTEEAMAGLRSSLIDRLDHGASIDVLRQRAAGAYEGKKRVLKPESERRLEFRQWSMTISDVYLEGRRQGAANRVRRWATSIRSEFEGGGRAV